MRTVKIAMVQLKNYYEDQASGYRAAASIITQAAVQGIENFRLMGGSLIVNADGELIVKMGSNEGYEISAITLGTAFETPVKPSVYHGKWLHPGNTLYRYLIMPMLIKKGCAATIKSMLYT